MFDHQNEKLDLKVQTDDLVGKQGREKDAKVGFIFPVSGLGLTLLQSVSVGFAQVS